MADIHSTNQLLYLDQQETTMLTDLRLAVSLSAHPPSYPSRSSGSIWSSWTRGQGNLTLLRYCKTGVEGSGPGRWRSVLRGPSAFLCVCVCGEGGVCLCVCACVGVWRRDGWQEAATGKDIHKMDCSVFVFVRTTCCEDWCGFKALRVSFFYSYLLQKMF